MTEKKARTKTSYRNAASKPDEKKAPWEKKNTKKNKGSGMKLTDDQKAEAKARAEKAGRPYPNLVDNMAVARKAAKEKKS